MTNQERLFDEVMDDCEESVTILGRTFRPSEIVKALDPILYREAMKDFMDQQD